MTSSPKTVMAGLYPGHDLETRRRLTPRIKSAG
jgi:hypothetical protein